jgi:hypothetical protein
VHVFVWTCEHTCVCVCVCVYTRAHSAAVTGSRHQTRHPGQKLVPQAHEGESTQWRATGAPAQSSRALSSRRGWSTQNQAEAGVAGPQNEAELTGPAKWGEGEAVGRALRQDPGYSLGVLSHSKSRAQSPPSSLSSSPHSHTVLLCLHVWLSAS